MNMHPKNHYDALIIGAGPAGATAAYLLATDGCRVGIIEKSRFPRFKLCGGLLTQKTIELLKNIFNTEANDLKSKDVIQYQSNFYGVGDCNGNFLQGKLGFPFHFVDRQIYDAFWVETAVKAGAELIVEEKAETLDIAKGQAVTQSGRQFKGRFIIAADGVFSRMRSRLSQLELVKCRRRQDVAAALEVFIAREKLPGTQDYPAIYFGYVPWGYAWSFPGPHNQIFGICSLKAKAKQTLAKSFKNFIQAQRIPPQEFANPRGYALPYGNYLSNAGYKNILLIGDAGGFADPLLGEGIYYSHKSAQMAVDAIKQSWSHPQKAQAFYSQLLKASIITELKYAKMIRQFLFSLPAQWHYRLVSFWLKKMPRKLEEAVQGQRSFKLLLPKSSIF